MSAGSENEDHSWPAFVDALTTIVMILTFVMMILAVAIAVMSENVSKVMVEQIAKVISKDPPDPNKTAEQMTREVIEAIEKLKATPPPPPVQTQPVEQEKKIESAAVERAPDQKVAVTSSQSALTLTFPPRQSRLDAAGEAELKTFLTTSAPVANAKTIDVRAYASLAVGSLSEAKRFAYYRAMIMRSTMIQNGIPADKIAIQVEVSNAATDTDVVRVFAK
jgi:outer membrane protein OmpA-like peptidoglycan-associated protein